VVNKWLIAVFMLFATNAWSAQDPTAPLGWTKQEQPSAKPKKVRPPLPRLQAIVCLDEKNCSATLSGEVRLVGELINGYRLNQVDSDAVILSRGKQQWKLELFSMEVKQ